jgi:hypothetical protein
MKRKYFVSYSYQSRVNLNQHGFGNTVILAEGMESREDIHGFEQAIRDDIDLIEVAGRNAIVCLLNFKEL